MADEKDPKHPWLDRPPPPRRPFERDESTMRSRAAPWFRDPRWETVDQRVTELVLELRLTSPASPGYPYLLLETVIHLEPEPLVECVLRLVVAQGALLL